MSKAELEFFGAAGEVTGSCHILRCGAHQVLLDCGMIQGGRKAEARNADPFPFSAEHIDAVVLSHAHIDHSGRLPLLAKRGFDGPIHAQNATKDLAHTLLKDAGYLQEADARRENKWRRKQRKPPVKPLFDQDDAAQALSLFTGHRYATWFDVVPGLQVRFHDAGHIMGSAIVEAKLSVDGLTKTLVFSGDLGQFDTPILRDPRFIAHADVVLMESTYGGRTHRYRADTIEELAEILRQAERDQGNVLVPAFAVGRSQEILYHLGKHYKEWNMQRWRIFLDSPMAIAATKIYWDYPHLYDDEATKLSRVMNPMPSLPNLELSSTANESKAINDIKSGAIVIAGSGMCSGGRILHHLKNNLMRPEARVLFTGYQAYGSLGRRIVDGKDSVKIHGNHYDVRAQVSTVGGLSAHGDENDLSAWYGEFKNRPPVYLVHGDPDAGRALKKKLADDHSTVVTLANPGMQIDFHQLGG